MTTDNAKSRIVSEDRKVAIYHVVYAREDFDAAAQVLFALVQRAQADVPGRARHLFLDIDGHRNTKGGFDNDMFELQSEFLMKVLLPFLTEVTAPFGVMRNTKPQQNDIPPELRIERIGT